MRISKHTLAQLFAAATCAGLILTACDGKKMSTEHERTEAESNAEFAMANSGATIEFVSYADTIYVELPSMTEMMGKPSYAQMSTTGVYPTSWGKVDLKPLQQQLLRAAYGTDTLRLKDAIEYYALHPAELIEDGKMVELAPTTLLRDSTMSEQSAVIAIKSMTSELLSMSVMSYTYPYGAAHGMYGTTYFNFYVPTAQVLDQRLVFDEKNHNNIVKVIREAAENQYAKQDTGVDANEIDAFDNFYISDGAITFVYAPYDIGPYSAGEVNVTIDSYLLYDYLTPLGKAIFGF